MQWVADFIAAANTFLIRKTMQPENRENDTELLSGLITARNLGKSFTNGGVRIEILRDLNFDLSAGETVAIVGASGIGKSTLLHILGTLDRPDSGQPACCTVRAVTQASQCPSYLSRTEREP